ncbi:MAG: hypothetical protein EOP61_04840 [Sphingomonadales bacterium]|nr:MAG: hypothetical protein EOP61_04840 [Sphingomonadales bacterium]
MAIVMALTLVAGFSVQLGAGRSSFGAPLHVHVHAVVFFGWVALYVVQNALVSRGSIGLHRKLGWIGAGWALAMVGIGLYTNVTMVQQARVPFFFTPAYFFIMDSLVLLGFVGLTAAAIVKRKETDWHRRLHYCGMALLTAPGWGRLLPMPFLIPYAGWVVFAATMIFPTIGVLADLRRRGSVHPAWWTGVAVMAGLQLATAAIGASPLGAGLYEAVTAGTPGAAVPALEYPPLPPTP